MNSSTNIMLAPDDDLLGELLRQLADARDSLETAELRRRADILLSGADRLDQLRGQDREDYRVALEAFCYVNDLLPILRSSGVEHAYNYRDDFPQEPQGGLPDRAAKAEPTGSLLSRPVAFPIGVPASVLTADSRWVRFFARHGFNVLTFKTVRSRAWEPHPFPNWVFLEDADEPLPVGIDPRDVVVYGDESTYLRRLRAFSMANSFGVPSTPPSKWGPEIKAALEVLRNDQILIVSVMGTAHPADPPETLLEDFVKVSRMAMDAGAPAIELNLSCPNTLDPTERESGVKPPLCNSLYDTVQIVQAVAREVGEVVPLVAKLSYLPLPDLAPLVREINPYVHAISGINTLQVRVERRRGGATFGERQLAGLSGVAIRRLALDFVRSLDYLRRSEPELEYDIIGMGGVMDPADVYALLAVGADAVQTATAASVNPRLPQELRIEEHHEAVPRIRSLLYQNGRFRSPREIAELLEGSTGGLRQALEPLGDLDLPRRVAELVIPRVEVSVTPALELDPDVWGPPPPPEQIDEIQRATKRRLEREQQHVLERSVAPEVVAERLGWSVEEVDRRLDDGRLVYFEWAGRRVVPEWQFDERDGETVPLPGLTELRQAFARDVVALDAWVNTPNSALAGKTPREELRAGNTERVLSSLLMAGAVR